MKDLGDMMGKKEEDFSLVQGGLLFQILQRFHLCGNSMQWLRRRLLIFVGVTWLPLVVLSAWEGQLWGGSKVPFLLDVSAHTRFLVMLPLLFVAEFSVHERMRTFFRLFLDRGLIPDSARGEFDDAVASGVRHRNSIVAELVLLGMVYGISMLFDSRPYSTLGVRTWSGERVDGRLHPSWAGWWFGYVSLPILQFLLLRWYFRLFIWLRFLWRVSRIDLHILPTHPDRSGGLGFLGELSLGFLPLLFAQGAGISGALANAIFYEGAKLTDFAPEIAGLVAAMTLSVIGPLLVFSPRLARVKRIGFLEYGTLAQRYVREFDRKWLRGGAPPEEPLVGSGDIQSLADLGGSYDIISEMKPVPFKVSTVILLAVTAIVPIAPLVLTMVSFPELVARILKVVL